MKTIITALLSLLTCATVHCQETVGESVLKKTKDKTYQRGEQKTDDAVDEALDKVEDGIKNIFKKKDKKSKSEEAVTENQEESKKQSSSPTKKGNKTNSKFDFEPGKKQLAFDDFSTTDVGDFPLGWNTNSSAEIVTLDDSAQKWLSITKDGYFQPEYIKDMPDNFTLEFEIFTRYKSSNILEYQLYIMPSKNPKKDLSDEYPDNYFRFNWLGCNEVSSFYIVENGEKINSNTGLKISDLDCGNGNNDANIAKFSIWRQNGRLRIYINENKILDLPQAFDMKQKYNVFKIGAKYMNFSTADNPDEFMISNIRYAVAGEDTRSKLITEGKFVTTGILFDVNSDNIKPESGVVLKEIATTLQENPTIKVKIIGHTDSDGDANANLALSQKRAAAIKIALNSFYGIDNSRLETDGKGESQPLNKNANAAEKSENRRVEFIKL